MRPPGASSTGISTVSSLTLCGADSVTLPFRPCVSGATYRVACDTRGPGPVKVWVRGYGPFRGRRVRRYEAVMNCAPGAGAWRTTTMEFNPTARRPEVDELRVMLYAWYPAGVYWFDRVRVERIDAAPAAAGRE